MVKYKGEFDNGMINKETVKYYEEHRDNFAYEDNRWYIRIDNKWKLSDYKDVIDDYKGLKYMVSINEEKEFVDKCRESCKGYICFKNGVLNQKLEYEVKEDVKSFWTMDFEYKGEINEIEVNWIKKNVLYEIFGNEALVREFMNYIYYLLIGVEHRSLIIKGDHNSGKSVICQLLGRLSLNFRIRETRGRLIFNHESGSGSDSDDYDLLIEFEYYFDRRKKARGIQKTPDYSIKKQIGEINPMSLIHVICHYVNECVFEGDFREIQKIN